MENSSSCTHQPHCPNPSLASSLIEVSTLLLRLFPILFTRHSQEVCSQKFGNAFPTAWEISPGIVVADILLTLLDLLQQECQSCSYRRGTFMAQGRKMKGGMEARESVYHSDHIVFRVSCRPTPSEKGRGLVLRGILIHGSLFVCSRYIWYA